MASVPLNIISLKETEHQRDSLEQHIEMFELIQYRILDLMEVQKENIEVEEVEPEEYRNTQHQLRVRITAVESAIYQSPCSGPRIARRNAKTLPGAQLYEDDTSRTTLMESNDSWVNSTEVKELIQ